MIGIINNKSSLGGGIRGSIPRPIIIHDNSKTFTVTRFTLRESWNTTTYPFEKKLNYKRVVTPFRAVTNSGDILGRENYTCGGSCQTYQSRPGLKGLASRFGHIQNNCDGTGIPPASCNVKYVYDSSNYTRFLKEKAFNKNYNALSFGGDDNNANQVIMRSIRRY